MALCKVTTWQGQLVIKKRTTLLTNYSITSIFILSCKWVNTATLEKSSERREANRWNPLRIKRRIIEGRNQTSRDVARNYEAVLPSTLENPKIQRELWDDQAPEETADGWAGRYQTHQQDRRTLSMSDWTETPSCVEAMEKTCRPLRSPLQKRWRHQKINGPSRS